MHMHMPCGAIKINAGAVWLLNYDKFCLAERTGKYSHVQHQSVYSMVFADLRAAKGSAVFCSAVLGCKLV